MKHRPARPASTIGLETGVYAKTILTGYSIMKKILLIAAALLTVPAIAQEASEEGWQDTFPIDEYTMTASGENQYWNLTPGRFVVIGDIEPDTTEFVVITVLHETELVNGIETRVVEEREYENGQLAEVSRNFFATAEETGDVFYFGEDVDYYENGEVVRHDGEWRAGQDNAMAGLYMPHEPIVGMRYYMEVAPQIAMDRAEIFETDAAITTPAGTFSNSLIVTESSPLEPDDDSFKRYAPGVGMIFDDGLELLKYGERRKSERWFIEFKITESQLPTVPAGVLQELHPTGVAREVKVELRRSHARYAIETLVDGKQWDVEVNDAGEVNRNERD